uniref:Uncharacterized protein n=1 Tax=Timema genevievae TaxID=629358 RepID=A0A7R9PHL4_TIMGE|nr:unnamed protein product [Timema genevievae]
MTVIKAPLSRNTLASATLRLWPKRCVIRTAPLTSHSKFFSLEALRVPYNDSYYHSLTMTWALVVATTAALTTNAQHLASYGQHSESSPQQYQPQPAPLQQYQTKSASPLPIILSHKQGLTSDGAFNYNFATDHGLQQGETINPDGSRTGGYSYVDPNGKTISVKYSAGKDGFKILEGDHIPKPVIPIAPAAPQGSYNYRPASAVSPRPAYPRYTSANIGEGIGEGSLPYYKKSPILFSSQQQDQGQYNSGYDRPNQAYSGSFPYNVQEETEESNNQGSRYSTPYKSSGSAPFYPSSGPGQYLEQSATADEVEESGPRKPHTFGNGYSFEFAG